jgi:hypothetical protein
MPHKLALLALAGCTAATIAYDANRAFTQAVADQVAQEESAFCLKLGMLPGQHYEACLQDVARLVRREDEIRSIDF